jgi:D-alanyl-D-alanine endopeptidase (penicillin-binding protein 7)
LKYAKVLGLVALAALILLGYRAERIDPEISATVGDAAETTELASAVPLVPLAPQKLGDWKLPLGPLAEYEPPRKMRPRIYAQAACVVDCQTRSLLYGRNEDQPRPIASLVKLLTTLTYLESGGDLDAEIEITPEDAKGAGKSVLWKGHRFKARDVLYTALLSSDNRAARALARSTPYSLDQFIERMNARAKAIGCRSLSVVEPTGLSELNVASALDVARLLAAALANPTLSEVCRTYRHQFQQLNGRKKYRIVNSNRLLLSHYKELGGKTGYIVEAGWCVANMIDTPEGPMAVVILGASSNSSRFAQSRKLTDWALRYRHRADDFVLAQ